jgi:hypothetical protein
MFNWKYLKWILLLLTIFVVRNFLISAIRTLSYPIYGDEAETVILSLTTLRHGFPTFTDNNYYFSGVRGAEFGPGGVDIVHSWLQHYLTAGIIAISGYRYLSPYVRIPYMILGALVALLLYQILNKISGQKIYSILIVLFVYSGNYLLSFLFNIRYYGLSAFSLALFIIGWIIHCQNERRWFYLLSGGILLYYSHWSAALPVLAVFGISDLLCRRSYAYLRPWLLILILTLPQFIICYPLGKFILTENRFELVSQVIKSPVVLSLNINLFPMFYLVALISLIMSYLLPESLSKDNKKLLRLCFIATLLEFVLISQSFIRYRDRYFVYLLPFYGIYISMLFQEASYLMDSFRLKRLFKIFIPVTSFIISIIAFSRLNSPSPYVKGYENITLDWISKYSSPGDSIYVNFDRRDVMLHTNLHIVNASDFAILETAIIKDPMPLYRDPTYMPMEKVKWIFWDKAADHTARYNYTWANPDYVSVKIIPENFIEVYSNPGYSIYLNKIWSI